MNESGEDDMRGMRDAALARLPRHWALMVALAMAVMSALCALARPAEAAADGPRVLLNERRVTVEPDGRMRTVVRKTVRTGAPERNHVVNAVEVSWDGSVDEARWLWARRGEDAGPEGGGEDLLPRLAPLRAPEGEQGGLVSLLVRLPLEGGGDAAGFAYEIVRTKPAPGAQFWNIHVFSDAAVVDRSVFTIEFPASRRIYYHAQGVAVEPVIEKAGEMTRYTWTMKNVAKAADEGKAPYVAVSSTPDWGDLFPWLNAMYARAVIGDADMNRLAGEALDKFEHNMTERMRQMYSRVSAGVISEAMSAERRALPPNDAREVSRRGVGDCKDKTVMLIALLGAAHVEAYPALLNTEFEGDIQAQLPHPYYFNHAIVYVPKQRGVDSELWLDPTIPGREWFLPPPQAQGRQALVLMGEKTRFVRIGNM